MEKNTLMLLSDEQVKKAAELLDEVIDFKDIIKNKALGAGAELFDGKAFRISINALNGFASPHIPDDFKDEFQKAVDDLLDGDKDFTEAADQFFIIASQLIDGLENIRSKPYVLSGAKVIIEMIKTFVHMTLDTVAEKE